MIETLSNIHPVTASCQAMSIPFRSYYHFAGVGKTVREKKDVEDTLIRAEVETLIHGDCSTYGYRMMTRQLKKDGFRIRGKPVNHKRVLRVMRENNVLCEIKKSFINTTDSNHPFFKYANILKKEKIKVLHVDQVWSCDFTYIRLPEGFCYLAIILDAFSRKVIGYCLSKDMDVELVLTALKMAVQERRVVNADQKLIHHSDHGVQYCSHEYTDLLKFHGIRISMSDFGSPWQNGRAESFFKTLKKNEVYLKDYQNIWEAKANLFKFIDDVYNAKRLHSSLDYISPNEFEEKLLTTKSDQIAPISV
jgi:transposase InsO family protein